MQQVIRVSSLSEGLGGGSEPATANQDGCQDAASEGGGNSLCLGSTPYARGGQDLHDKRMKPREHFADKRRWQAFVVCAGISVTERPPSTTPLGKGSFFFFVFEPFIGWGVISLALTSLPPPSNFLSHSPLATTDDSGRSQR